MAAKKGARKSKAKPSPLQNLVAALARGEVAGIVLLFISAITLLSLVTSSSGVLTSAWLNWLQGLFGIGLWGFPMVTGVLGLWMVIRTLENKPELSWQRPMGLVILFLSTLVGATLWTQSANQPPAGGQVGFLLGRLVTNAIGVWGAWAFATFLAITGVVLLADRLLLNLWNELAGFAQPQRNTPNPGETPPSIAPVVPLPSGMLPWWKRVQELWRKRPALTVPPALTNWIKPEPANQSQASAQPGSVGVNQPTQPMRGVSVIPPHTEGEMLTPRIIGGAQEWRLPRLHDMLRDWERHADDDNLIRQQGRIIQETLALFGVPADFEGAYKGPSVTQYLIKPGYVERNIQGELKRLKVKVAKIAALANDLALALAAPSVRIEAPIPGTNYVGVEVPNHEGNIVGLKELMESESFQNMKGRLRIALGEDVKGQPVIADLARMPHLLIAGATGTGKSVCINSIIGCLLLTHTPDSLRFLMVDPKMVELSTYNGTPHLLSPVVTEVDKAAAVLFWAVKEMERRYALFSKAGARDLVRYNEYLNKRGEKSLPYIVVIVDEMADLMMAAPEEVEKHICRLAQMARAVGIHLIIATQRPSVDVITGLIKANFPARIAFAVTSQTDSRVILDVPGAERLLGRGDMLFMAPDASKLERLQGSFLHDDEINKVVRYWKGIRSLEAGNTLELNPDDPLGGPATFATVPGATEKEWLSTHSPARAFPPATATPSGPLTGLTQGTLLEEAEAMRKAEGRDELFDKAVQAVQATGRGSVSLLQRKLRIGYNRAARLVEQLEEAGILGPEQGAQGREVLTGKAAADAETPVTPLIIGGMEDDEPDGPPPTRIWM
jgi:S-DNA-T family DNA segregation ATPase FtsK/SpoIIIE